MSDFTTLENIFQMMEPADLFGAKKLSLGKKAGDVNVIKRILDVLYNAGGTGARPIATMISALNEDLSKASPAAQTDFTKVFHVFSSGGEQLTAVDEGKDKSLAADGKTPVKKTTFAQIVGPDVDLPPNKKMCIITLSSPFLSPAVRNAEQCELFLNAIPSIHASRMSPLLEVEFAFHRVIDASQAPHEQFGQIRFLMGGQKPADGSPTAKLVAARVSLDKMTQIETTTAGMEMFTSPQTLVNPDPVTRAGRYSDVLDPFRPFATLESLTITVASAGAGLYSYKKAMLNFKLHDRSRLAEIADLVRPQIYQNAKTAPTVWLTYGWRYPYEPGEPTPDAGSRTYSDFINNNMLVREAYAVANSQFSFDNVGQVNVTLELWTKGVAEMRTISITDSNDGFKQVRDRIEAAAQRITDYANALGFGKPEGISREIRSYQIIESAERGTYLSWTNDEIQKALASLEASFRQATIDHEAADNLTKELRKFYANNGNQSDDIKQKIKQTASEIAHKKFNACRAGYDPFLPSSEKDAKNPLAAACDTYDKQLGTAEINKFKKKLCSFGKLFSIFVAHALKCNDSVEELQLFFHQFNDKAGRAGATNIAEFPIEMPVFFDQYRQLIEAKRTESLTLEEFLKLCVDAQLGDERAFAYGFGSSTSPGNNKQVKEGKFENALAGIGNKLGPFVKPTIEVYIETTFASDGTGTDLLRRFELQEMGTDPEVAKSNHLTRIMRIHIFDRSNNPYKAQGLILKGGNGPGGGARFREVTNDWLAHMNANKIDPSVLALKPGLTQSGGTVLVDFALSNDGSDGGGAATSIKQMVSKTMPSIIYGSNASMVTNATLTTTQDPLLATSQMQTVAAKSGKPSVGQPNGSGQNGLPLRIIPASLSMSTMGCPLLSFGQLYFVDFSSGTTLDNIYGLTGITHTMTPGKFESQLKLTFFDAYGRYEGAPDIIDYYIKNKVPDKKK